MSTRLGVDAANIGADAVAERLASGYIRFYTGTRPTTADSSTSETLLAEASFESPAFGAATGGEITATSITEVSISATGTPGWFRAVRSDGTTVEFDGTVGTENADCIVSSVSFQVNQSLQITALTFRFLLS